jgi:3-oxoacyl-[acyl-carrier-protein] synthase II
MFIPDIAAGLVSIRYGLKGPNFATVSACASSAHAIGESLNLIRHGLADAMVTGGAEASITGLTVAAFSNMRALSSRNDSPETASRPFDRDRDGFVLADGGAIVVLESLEHAQARGARIYAEVIGYGMSADAFHITAPAEDGDGAYRCMKMALNRAGVSPSEIDYVNAHGTSTPMGDEIELKAVERLFGNTAGKLAMSSTKSAIGHLLGAAGAVEAIFSTLAIRDNIAPPTLNLDTPSVDTAIDLVPHTPKKRDINIALSNSFGFGGTNACLVLRRAA